MSAESKRPYLKRHPDDDYIDEVRIVVRERYKTSGVSGDEWRFHRVIELYRKGVLLYERAFNGHMATVAGFLPWVMSDAGESGEMNTPNLDHLCSQPGCPEPATSEYELIEEFGSRGEKLDASEAQTAYQSVRRHFCQQHLRRGDCGREDCDANYRVLSGVGPDGADMSRANIQEAARVDVRVNSLDELPAAIDAARRAFEGNR